MKARHWLLIPLAMAVAAGGLIWGGKNTYTSLRNRSPVELKCGEFAVHPPDAQWLRLRDCDFDFDHMGIESSGTRETAVYIPMRLPNGGDAKLILTTDREPLLSLGNRSRSAAVVDAVEAWMADVAKNGLPGLLELSVDRSARKKRELHEIGLDAENAAIFEYGATPRPLVLALGALLAGLVALAYLVWRFRPARKPDLPRAQIVQT